MLGIPLIESFIKGALKSVSYDDFADRLSYYVSSFLMFFFAVFISAKQYFGSPIQCWVNAEWKSSWEQYAEDYCFIQNTYWLDTDERQPNTNDHASIKDREIGYYQWVPLVFCLQGLMFYTPNLIWRATCFQSGLCIRTILSAAKSIGKEHRKDKRVEQVQDLARYIQEQLDTQHHLNAALYRSWNPLMQIPVLSGGYVTFLYMFIKVLYIVNIVLQYVLLNALLDTDFFGWGWQVTTDILSGQEWQRTAHFPRTTFCKVPQRRYGKDDESAPHVVQCVLMINMFNEKIFLFMWFWLLLVAFVTVINLIYWLFTQFMPGAKRMYVDRYARSYCGDMNWDEYNARLAHFVDRSLRNDGCLMLRFIATHCGHLAAISLVIAMFQQYLRGKQPAAVEPTDDESKVDTMRKQKLDNNAPIYGRGLQLYHPLGLQQPLQQNPSKSVPNNMSDMMSMPRKGGLSNRAFSPQSGMSPPLSHGGTSSDQVSADNSASKCASPVGDDMGFCEQPYQHLIEMNPMFSNNATRRLSKDSTLA